MLAAVIAGERSPRVLAELAHGTMRRKTARLEEALDCSFFTGEHAFILQMMLDNIDHLTAQITVLDKRITVLCEPYERQVAQLDGIPSFGVTTAQDLIAEIGTGMTAFPTAGHLCSWARPAPRVQQSGGKRKGKNATGRGNPYLGEDAAGAGRTQTFLGAKYRRLRRHMPKRKAQGAIMRTQLGIAHALLSDPEARYRDLGPAITSSAKTPAAPTPTSQPRAPRLEGHHRAPRPRHRHRRGHHQGQLTTALREASGTNRRRLQNPARLRSYFRVRSRLARQDIVTTVAVNTIKNVNTALNA
jgi:Transposase IS116/IS110/IS902 family